MSTTSSGDIVAADIPKRKGFDVDVGSERKHLFIEADSIEEAIEKLERFFKSQGIETKRDGSVLSLRHKKSERWRMVYPFPGHII